MEGFFSNKETQSQSRPDGKILSCVSCGLYKDCASPRMRASGNFKKGILNIGEAPGAVEDTRGTPFQGKAGKLLQKWYEKLGIDLFEDCLNVDAVHCRPVDGNGGTRTPTNYEVECCRRETLKLIEDKKPKVVMLFGQSALYSVIGHRWKKDLGTIEKWRGWRIPDLDFKTWICPTYHPSYLEKMNGEEVLTVWLGDLKYGTDMAEVPFPKYKEPIIEVLTDLSVLDTIKKGMIAFDYETTGIKPHAAEHKIVCASVAYDENHCYVFRIPGSKRARQPFIDLLARKGVKKMAHNMKFEDTWSAVRLRQEVQNWYWDSMLAAHQLDNRRGISGLKFQSYVQFGIVDYSSEISPYLESTDSKNGNSLNRVFDLLERPGGEAKLMHYCALDSIYQYRLAVYQQKLMGYQ